MDRSRIEDTLNSSEDIEARAGLYEMLSHVFMKEPSPEFLEFISGTEVAPVLRELGIDVVFDDVDTAAEELAREYAYLFLGPGKHLPPFESVQRGTVDDSGQRSLGQMHGEPARQMIALYDKHNLEVVSTIKDQPDHLAAELAFMAHLCRQELDLVPDSTDTGGDDTLEQRLDLYREQSEFLREHLGVWAPDYCRLVSRTADSSYFREFAKLTANFIQSELAELDEAERS